MKKQLVFAAASVLVLPAILAAQPRGPMPCVKGAAGPFPCRLVDQASFVPLSVLSNNPTDKAGELLGWRHEATGREFALVALASRTTVVEVTDPESPQVIGYFGLFTGGLGPMAIFEDRLYSVVNQGGPKLDIFDLTRLLAGSPPESIPADASVALPFFGGLSINPETGYAYVHSLEILALDLNQDPENPVQVMLWNPTSPHPRNLECVIYHGPDQRFVGHEICFGGAGNTWLVIYDVTDKAHPVRLSSTKYKHSNTPWDTALTEDHRFLLLADASDERLPGGNTRTHIWNLSNLNAPVNFKSHDGPTRARDLDLEVRGRYAYLANAASGLRILDLQQLGAKKSRVREAAHFDVEPGLSNTSWFGAWDVDVLPSGTVIVGSIRQGLFVLDPQL